MYRFPTKNKIECSGETIEYVMAGEGPASIVLVNGSGGPIEGWHKVFGALTDGARVFAYNRPGVGGSSRPARPQTGSHMVASLRSVLATTGCRPPYVLVGHSFGGFVVDLFARLHPSDVGAVVMIEASTVADVDTLPAMETRFQKFAARLAERLFPPDANGETQHVKATAAEIRSAPPFPPVPLRVITGTKPAMGWATAENAIAARRAHQRQLASLSPLGRQVLAMKSGHFPQFSEPDVVIAAVKEAAMMVQDVPTRADAMHPS